MQGQGEQHAGYDIRESECDLIMTGKQASAGLPVFYIAERNCLIYSLTEESDVCGEDGGYWERYYQI